MEIILLNACIRGLKEIILCGNNIIVKSSANVDCHQVDSDPGQGG